MNARAMFAIVRKDLKVVRQNKGVMMPIISISLVVFAILPWAVAQIPVLVELLGIDILGDLKALIELLSTGLQQEFAGYDLYDKLVVYFLVYMMAPLFLLIPLMVSTVIAADSFAGEKERKTMEALLYTPTTDRELFVAKLLSSWLAALAVALVGFALYAIMVNAAAWPQMQRIFFPNALWLVLIFWVVPAIPGLGLGVIVLVSVRAQGFQDAIQMGGFVVLPVMLLGVGLLSGAMSFSIAVMFLVGLVIWLLDGLLIWLGSRSFRRGRLLGA
ncbi:MAG TPA: ABC transporter permease subunit [Anaerolineales bacterium]|nr:ABC transporter permease subunit [Anaerolineales bacterium]